MHTFTYTQTNTHTAHLKTVFPHDVVDGVFAHLTVTEKNVGEFYTHLPPFDRWMRHMEITHHG